MELTPFDQFATDDFLQIIKIMIPYLPDSIRRTAGIYVKLTELSNVLHKPAYPSLKSTDASMLDVLSPYLPDEFQQYADMFEMMQSMDFSEMFSSERNSVNE